MDPLLCAQGLEVEGEGEMMCFSASRSRSHLRNRWTNETVTLAVMLAW